MKKDDAADAYIIACAGLVTYKNEAKVRLNCTRKHLIRTHGISPSRIKLIDGGYTVQKVVQMFLVKTSEPKPEPYPIVNREAVRIDKGTQISMEEVDLLHLVLRVYLPSL